MKLKCRLCGTATDGKTLRNSKTGRFGGRVSSRFQVLGRTTCTRIRSGRKLSRTRTRGYFRNAQTATDGRIRRTRNDAERRNSTSPRTACRRRKHARGSPPNRGYRQNALCKSYGAIFPHSRGSGTPRTRTQNNAGRIRRSDRRIFRGGIDKRIFSRTRQRDRRICSRLRHRRIEILSESLPNRLAAIVCTPVEI